jgi:hypothetical protein
MTVDPICGPDGWPQILPARDVAGRASLEAACVPCLVVVAAGCQVGRIGHREDWVREGAGEQDVAARLAALALRWGDGAGVDHMRDPHGAALLHLFCSNVDRLVPRSQVLESLQGESAALETAIVRAKLDLRLVGLELLELDSGSFVVVPEGDPS